MTKVPGIETILNAAELISDIRKAFLRIEKLEESQRSLADAMHRLDGRVRELEAELRVAKSEIRLDAVKEAQSIVNSVQSNLYSEIRDISIQLHTIYKFTEGSPLQGSSRMRLNSEDEPGD